MMKMSAKYKVLLTFTIDKFKKVKFVSLEMLVNEGEL